MAKVNGDLADAAGAQLQAQADLIAQSEGRMADSNQALMDALGAYTKERVVAFQGAVGTLSDAVDGWMNDKLAWAELLADGWHKDQLVQELVTRRESILESLDARSAEAQTDADTALANLRDNLDSQTAELQSYDAAMTQGLTGFVAALTAETADAAAVINADFNGKADEQLKLKNDAADQTAEDWAFWLKYLYGYSGYDKNIYRTYDDTIDYDRGFTLSYQQADGAYLDLGY